MNKLLLAAVAATLLVPSARAQNSRPRRVSVAHVSAPARSSGSSIPASIGGRTFYGTQPVLPGGQTAGGIDLALAAARSMYAGASTGGRPPSAGRGLFSGGGRYAFHDSSFWGRRLDTGSGSATPPANDPSVPSVIMPGQLIRTAGLGALVSPADSSPAPFAIEAGNKIAYEDNKGYALTTAPGVFTGPKDTLPPPNPTSGGGSSGGNSITENNNVSEISHSGNGAGNTTGSGASGGGTQNGN